MLSSLAVTTKQQVSAQPTSQVAANTHAKVSPFLRPKSSVYDCTVEDVENVSIVTHSHHLVVVITLP